MSNLEHRLDRIEQLLIESNQLRQQAIDIQAQAMRASGAMAENAKTIQAEALQTLRKSVFTVVACVVLLIVIWQLLSHLIPDLVSRLFS